MDELRNELERVVWHIAWAKDAVADGRNVVEKVQRAGYRVAIAEETLDTFVRTLKIFEDHERHLRAELERRGGPPEMHKHG